MFFSNSSCSLKVNNELNKGIHSLETKEGLVNPMLSKEMVKLFLSLKKKTSFNLIHQYIHQSIHPSIHLFHYLSILTLIFFTLHVIGNLIFILKIICYQLSLIRRGLTSVGGGSLRVYIFISPSNVSCTILFPFLLPEQRA